MTRLESIDRHGIKVRGQQELIRHLNQRKITLKAATLAKCYDCMGYYADGRADCEDKECPLYPFNPSGAQWKGRERKKINSTVAEAFKIERLRKEKREEVSA